MKKNHMNYHLFFFVTAVDKIFEGYCIILCVQRDSWDLMNILINELIKKKNYQNLMNFIKLIQSKSI